MPGGDDRKGGDAPGRPAEDGETVPADAGRPSEPTVQAVPVTLRGSGPGPHTAGVRLPQRYEGLGTLGGGGMGVVLKVLDRDLRREVALKILDAPHRGNAVLRERLVREARTLAALRHPSIVQIHDVDAERGLLVMELLPGGSLADRIREEGALSAARAIEIIRPILSALHAAHSAGIVHRDVKPSNILLDEHGAPKLCDFGVVRTHDSELTQEGSQPGTPAYMAPEQLRDRATDRRADIYATGATLYEMLTGRRYHKEPSESRRDPAAVLRAEGIDAAIAAVVARALAEEPEDRFGSAQELLEALERPPSTWTRRRPVVVLAVVLVLSAIAAIVALVSPGPEREEAPGIAFPDRPVVAFLPFRNETGLEELDFASHGIPRSAGSRFEEATGARIVGFDEIRDVVGPADRDLVSWRRAARGRGAQVAVEGKIAPNADGTVTITARVSGLDGARSQVELAATGRSAQLDALVREIAAKMAERLHRVVPSRDRQEIAARPLTTLRHLQNGVDALHLAEMAAAVRELEEAVALEPDSPEAWFHLAIARTWEGGVQGRLGLEAIDRALEVVPRRREKTILGALRLMHLGRYAEAAAVLEPLRTERPRDRDVLYHIGEAYFHGGDVRAGLAAFRAALGVAPAYLPSAIHPSRVYRAGRSERRARWVMDICRRFGQAEQAEVDEILLRFALGRYDEILESPLPPEGRARLIALRTRVAASLVRGDDATARTLLQGEMSDVLHGLIQWSSETALAAIAYRRGERAEARTWAERAAERAAKERDPARRGETRSALGLVRALAGDRAGTEADLAAVGAEDYGTRPPRTVVAFRAVAGWLLGRDELLEEALAVEDRDVKLLAEGLREEMRGNPERAAATLAVALDDPTEGRHEIAIRHALARNRHAIGDLAGVRVACDEIERPAVYQPFREPAVAECRRIVRDERR